MATITAAELDRRENLVTKLDGDGKPVGVHMLTGVVEYNRMYEHTTKLKTKEARLLFLGWVGIVESHQVLAFIKGCNRAVERKTLTNDRDRAIAAYEYAGIGSEPETPAKPHRHKRGCTCYRCVTEHAKAGCRSVHCHTCGF